MGIVFDSEAEAAAFGVEANGKDFVTARLETFCEDAAAGSKSAEFCSQHDPSDLAAYIEISGSHSENKVTISMRVPCMDAAGNELPKPPEEMSSGGDNSAFDSRKRSSTDDEEHFGTFVSLAVSGDNGDGYNVEDVDSSAHTLTITLAMLSLVMMVHIL